MSKAINLVSSLTVQQCIERLRENTAQDAFSLFGNESNGPPVRGNATREQFQIRRRMSGENRTSYYLKGRFVSTAEATEISCTLDRSDFEKAFWAIWFGFLLLCGFVILLGTLEMKRNEYSSASADPKGLLYVGGMVALGYGFRRLRDRKREEDRQYLVGFLTETLDAEVTDGEEEA